MKQNRYMSATMEQFSPLKTGKTSTQYMQCTVLWLVTTFCSSLCYFAALIQQHTDLLFAAWVINACFFFSANFSNRSVNPIFSRSSVLDSSSITTFWFFHQRIISRYWLCFHYKELLYFQEDHFLAHRLCHRAPKCFFSKRAAKIHKEKNRNFKRNNHWLQRG